MASGRILTVKILTDASGAQRGLGSASLQYGKFARALGKKSPSYGTEVGDRLVSGIDKALGTGLKIAGGAGAAVLGNALFKGFQRLNDIDQATAKLRGLGHSAEDVERIMDNALAAVKGTSFGLGEAAGVAAQMVAAGIQPGRQLEDTLSRVADAATIGGVSMEDMGGIWGKVAAKNKLQADVINQLTSDGIPVLQLLADHYGTTAEAAADMVRQGKVDFQGFSDAMNKGMGGAAKESGNTFMGAWANVQASMGRIGANLLEPLFNATKDGLKGLPALMEPLEDGAKRVGQALGDMLGWVQDNIKLLGILGRIAGIVVGALLTFRLIVGIMQAYQGVMLVVKAAMIGYQAAQAGLTLGTAALTGATMAQRTAALIGAAAQWVMNSAFLASPITWIVLGIIALIAVIVLIATKTTWFANIWNAVWNWIKSAAAAVWNWLKTAWQAVIQVWQSTVQGFQAAFKAIWNGIKSAFTAVWNALKAIVIGYITAWITVIRSIIAVFSSVWGSIKNAASAAWQWLTGKVRSSIDGWRAIIDAVKGWFSGVWQNVKDTASRFLSPITSIIDGIKRAFDNVVRAVRSAIDWIKQLKFPSPPGWLSDILGMSADMLPPAAYGYGTPLAARAGLPLPAWAPSPRLSAGGGLAGAGGDLTIININGGLDSADTIARRVEQLITARNRRNAGVVLARRTA